jgi:hypothetical protein
MPLAKPLHPGIFAGSDLIFSLFELIDTSLQIKNIKSLSLQDNIFHFFNPR